MNLTAMQNSSEYRCQEMQADGWPRAAVSCVKVVVVVGGAVWFEGPMARFVKEPRNEDSRSFCLLWMCQGPLGHRGASKSKQTAVSQKGHSKRPR
ncbi:unnamed protein product [Lota lota]